MSSLYLHIPFCEHKCIYCDFYSVAPNGSADAYSALVQRFLDSLKKEVDVRSGDERFQVPYETIFFGGGTPSLLALSEIKEILNLLSTRFQVLSGAEITLETNPGTVDIEKLRQFKAAGVNRISMGIQSFHDDDLKFLSRIHSAEQAKECVRNAYQAGFDNVSFDLIFALPSQTRERWRSNLEQAMELAPKHISTYSLIVEPNTPLHRMVESKQVMPLSAEADAELYEFTIDFLASHGYEQYEVSNFAQPGYKSRHNGNYWNHSNYLGFGPSAHSFWERQRWWNVANVVEYSTRLEQHVLPVAGDERLNVDQLRNEELFLGLRSEGVDIAGFRKRYDTDLFATHRQTIEHLLNERLAVLHDDRFKLTAKGYPLCDEICASFLI
ncbi:MAG: radical SAM family heme chaperone HemW [Ignavibacteriae bacterium]|nr:radical SAM family heme chaperone HemW [Ignavibacteriota bacterium]